MFRSRHDTPLRPAMGLRLAILAFLMVPAVIGDIGVGNARTGCDDALLHQRAIEHGRQHQPTQREIDVKLAAKARPGPVTSAGTSDAATLAQLYTEVMRRSAPEAARMPAQNPPLPGGEAVHGSWGATPGWASDPHRVRRSRQ